MLYTMSTELETTEMTSAATAAASAIWSFLYVSFHFKENASISSVAQRKWGNDVNSLNGDTEAKMCHSRLSANNLRQQNRKLFGGKYVAVKSKKKKTKNVILFCLWKRKSKSWASCIVSHFHFIRFVPFFILIYSTCNRILLTIFVVDFLSGVCVLLFHIGRR